MPRAFGLFCLFRPSSSFDLFINPQLSRDWQHKNVFFDGIVRYSITCLVVLRGTVQQCHFFSKHSEKSMEIISASGSHATSALAGSGLAGQVWLRDLIGRGRARARCHWSGAITHALLTLGETEYCTVHGPLDYPGYRSPEWNRV